MHKASNTVFVAFHLPYLRRFVVSTMSQAQLVPHVYNSRGRPFDLPHTVCLLNIDSSVNIHTHNILRCVRKRSNIFYFPTLNTSTRLPWPSSFLPSLNIADVCFGLLRSVTSSQLAPDACKTCLCHRWRRTNKLAGNKTGKW